VSQVVLDDHLSSRDVFVPLTRWTTVRFLREVRPDEVIKDERVPTVLQSLPRPTFVTIDGWFWDRTRRDPRYCIVYVAVREDEQREVPVLLRRLFRLPDFRTRAARMGKIVRVSRERVVWWQTDDARQHTALWSTSTSRRTHR
jgi:hypothetical protein